MTTPNEQRCRVAGATKQAQVFLLPPYEAAQQRRNAMLTAADLVRQAIEHAVRGGCDDLAHQLLALAQRAEELQGRK